MAVALVEGFDDTPETTEPSGEYQVVCVLITPFNDITADAWNKLCPKYDSLTPEQL